MILGAGKASIVLPIRLHNADGILRVEVGDIVLGSDVCARCIVEHMKSFIADGCWRQWSEELAGDGSIESVPLHGSWPGLRAGACFARCVIDGG